jgi:hypothetical protein
MATHITQLSTVDSFDDYKFLNPSNVIIPQLLKPFKFSAVTFFIIVYRTHYGAQTTRGGPPAWGFGVRLTTPHRKKQIRYEKDQ